MGFRAYGFDAVGFSFHFGFSIKALGAFRVRDAKAFRDQMV